MSKNQINYLLVLATLLIVWLYFNTFYVGAKMSAGPGVGRYPVPSRMMNVVPMPPDFQNAAGRLSRTPNDMPAMPKEMQEFLAKQKPPVAVSPVSKPVEKK